ncbi:MAG: hypothetical protein M2R45_00472 [Verrucomicrobia subdivision 3 bacterium]|nr:hypothetical protein [Limisphaerales bacterium]MCS1413649.1 hypothetical protein [Limisphaerales bacterium]
MKPSRFSERPLVDQLHWMVAITPLFTLVIFYILICHAGLLLGEWPGRDSADVRDLAEISIPFGFHAVITFIGIVMMSLSPIAWIALLSEAHRYRSLADYGIRFAVFIACLSLVLWIGFKDPGSFLNWFFD